jgi:hypothetical protein
LPHRSITRPVTSIPGLHSVLQPIGSTGARERETPNQLITRASERLRHRFRAVTPWDYERLVLEAFPEVFKAKCFAAMTSAGKFQPQPGSVLVVVVPQLARHRSTPVFDPMLNAITLRRIQEYIEQKTSPEARIEVRNPEYERVLVRCMVRLKPESASHQGHWLEQLNQALVDYISPWSHTGMTGRFGWTFRSDEMEAFVRKLPYVDFVTKFSMLHITKDDGGRYGLDDTASPDFEGSHPDTTPWTDQISPHYPWSIAIPNRTHILETLADTAGDKPIPPEVTGIGKLRIDDTFIIK